MIGIAFDVHHLRNRVLGFVTQSVNYYAAANRTVGTRATRLRCAGDLQPLGLSVNRRETEAESRQAGASNHGRLEKGPSGEIHNYLPNIARNMIDYQGKLKKRCYELRRTAQNSSVRYWPDRTTDRCV